MNYTTAFDRSNIDSESTREIKHWSAVTASAVLVVYAATRPTLSGVSLALAATPLVYRGITGEWPAFMEPLVGNGDESRTALTGDRGVHVREAIRLEKPVAEVYAFWRRFENLPRFMEHLESVQSNNGQSHWIAAGPAGVRVEWDAEIVNEVENKVIGWRSLPGADVVTAGSVNFDAVRGGRSTQVSVHLQYAAAGGRVGSFVASLFGREPSQTIREDLRRLKQVLEAGEIARTRPSGLERSPR
jgi:uncharacterized membrane protein